MESYITRRASFSLTYPKFYGIHIQMWGRYLTQMSLMEVSHFLVTVFEMLGNFSTNIGNYWGLLIFTT